MMPPGRSEFSSESQSAFVTEGKTRQESGINTFSILQIILTIGAIQVATMAFNLLRSKIVAVTAGPESVGVISVIDQAVGLIALISTFSLPFASVKFLSAAHSESREAFTKGYITFLRALFLISLLGTGVGIALIWGWPAILGKELAEYKEVVTLALLAIPATNLIGLLMNVMAAAQRVRASALLGLLTAILLAIVSGGGILIAGLHGYYTGNLAVTFALVAGGMWYLFRREGLRIHDKQVKLFQEVRRYPQALSFAGALYIISFTTPLAYLVARYAVLRAGGFIESGLLQAAMGLGLALKTVMRSSNALFLTPTMNRKGENREKFQRAVEFLRALSVVIGIIALPMVLFPNWWLFLLYSSKFAAAAPYVYLFVLSEAIQLLAGVNQALVIGLDHIAIHVKVCLLGDLGIMAFSWWLVPYYGIGGVAMAFLFNGLLIFTLTSWYLWSNHRIVIHKSIGWLPLYILAIIGVGGAVSSWSEVNTPGFLILKICLWTLFILSLFKFIGGKKGPLLQSLWQAFSHK
ncbi:MAG TPA: hypothetical protein VNM22_17915 [Candidatus Limnocylindrales bacterium]|nr:hypothetical protein [Candidatus Limnocylindrales bacterium]